MAAKRGKSKKASGASSKPPDDDLVFFLDRCLGRIVVAEALRAAGNRVEVHDDHFDQDAPDEEWLPKVGAKKWVLLTRDKYIQRNPLEVQQLLKGGVAAFVLRGGSLSGEAMARAFLAALTTIRRLVAKYGGPMVAAVSPGGHVSLIAHHAGLINRIP